MRWRAASSWGALWCSGCGMSCASLTTRATASTLPKRSRTTAGSMSCPAFTGLGAPHWDMYARGTIVGITRGTTRNHIIRASVESTAYQSKDLLDAMISDNRHRDEGAAGGRRRDAGRLFDAVSGGYHEPAAAPPDDPGDHRAGSGVSGGASRWAIGRISRRSASTGHSTRSICQR